MTTAVPNLGLGEQIAYLTAALELCVIEVGDVVRWADDQISRQDAPAYELIELALMTGSNRYDIANQLLRVAAPSLSRATVLPYVLAEAYQKLIADPTFAKPLAQGLYQSWCTPDYDFPDNLNLCGYFEDAYALAESGVFGTVEQVDRELFEFTARFQGFDRFMTVLGR